MYILSIHINKSVLESGSLM